MILVSYKMAKTDVCPSSVVTTMNTEFRDGIFKLLRSPGIDSKNSSSFFFLGGEGVILALFSVSKCICAKKNIFKNFTKSKSFFFC
jgi:hypothetical protein